MLLKVVLTPGKHTQQSNFRDGTLWVLLPSLPHWGSVPGAISFFRAPGGKWAQEQRYATGEPGKL